MAESPQHLPIQGPKGLITAAVMLAALMAILDISIVNVALSDIRASFGTPLDQIAWISTGYMMANIIVIPLTGWFQKRFGFRLYFTGSILLFTAASALCGLAWDLPSLVCFRALQGVGGGAIIPTAQAILFSRYPRREHGMAGALFGLGAVTGPLLGPTLGGYLIQVASWHWIFLINLPFGLLASALAWNVIEEKGFRPTKLPVDKVGIGLLGIGMISLQFLLEEGNREGWWDSPLMISLAFVSVTCLVTFIVHELETAYPAVDFRVFGNRNYLLATVINTLLGTVLFSGSFLFSLYCGTVMRYSSFQIGLLFLKGSAVQLALMPLLARFGGKLDGRIVVACGVTAVAYSLWLTAQVTERSSEGELLWSVFVRSLGMACLFVPLSVLALSDLDASQRGTGAGLYNLTRELGGSIGTAWMSTHLALAMHGNAAYLAEKVTPFTATLRGPVEVLALQGRVAIQALVGAFNEQFRTCALFFLLAALVVPFVRKAQGAGAPEAH